MVCNQSTVLPEEAWAQAPGTHTWQAQAPAQPRHGGLEGPPLCPQPATHKFN